jgi:thioredoxin-dependent peroxiredoxin
MPLEPGKKAPDFALPDENGNTVRLSESKGRHVVVFFYPKANTSG